MKHRAMGVGLVWLGVVVGGHAQATTDTHLEAAREFFQMFSPREVMVSTSMMVMEQSIAQMAKYGVPEDRMEKIRAAYRPRMAAQDEAALSLLEAVGPIFETALSCCEDGYRCADRGDGTLPTVQLRSVAEVEAMFPGNGP